ncbi:MULTISPECIES: hypothetical protein [unclassified Methanosarcina]|uniref:hypothetical protein n=1 Tax=unclassified Methanosarcina TaxID=2644672 RepID=UPI000615B15D|nr:MULTISPECIES: hypothetical protein [unclassified Methanosarcina]AKB19591.1 hypothetical protein MSWHS_2728 [Methanosarcina sp. WWM596]AKB22627.1 hypothetical protein MSWH1_2356 [Methanosarcina sp. WH1]
MGVNDSALGAFYVGEKGVLDLNNSELPKMELYPRDSVSVKVVDYEGGVLVVMRELEVKESMVIGNNPELE